MAIILPTLGPDRRATYSPFLPISPTSGKVLQVPMEARDLRLARLRTSIRTRSKKVETPVTGGHVKCQWKADWAMRWVALGVDYEMAGEDFIDSVTFSSKICRALDGMPPEGFNYELFIDDKGQKISKSKGNGIAVEEWLTYATPESLSLYMYQKPKTAKRLYFDVIPKAVDDYFGYLAAYQKESAEQRLDNPVWHIHSGKAPQHSVPVSFCAAFEPCERIQRAYEGYAVGVRAQLRSRGQRGGFSGAGPAGRLRHPLLRGAREAIQDLPRADRCRAGGHARSRRRLAQVDPTLDAEALQGIVYEVGKSYPFANLRDWFKALYEVLFGESQGPRFGSFIKAYGIDNTIVP